MQIYEGRVCPPPKGYIAIVVAKFNRSITQKLYDGAIAKLYEHGVREQDIHVAWVPGAFELPLVADRFAQDEECLAVIGLGAVIRGETSHDEHINRAISLQFANISVSSGIPVIFGVLTCNTVEQAIARSGGEAATHDKAIGGSVGNKGSEAAEAALEMIDLLNDLPDVDSDPFEMISSMMNHRFGDEEETSSSQSAGFRPPPMRKKMAKKAVKKATKKTPKKK